jgi:hypothetical protein
MIVITTKSWRRLGEHVAQPILETARVEDQQRKSFLRKGQLTPKEKALREDTKGKTNSTIDFPSNYKSSAPLEGRKKKEEKRQERRKRHIKSLLIDAMVSESRRLAR